MSKLKKIHPSYNIYFRTLGNTVQSRVTILSSDQYTDNDPINLIEPGRIIVIGDIDDELRRLMSRMGKPRLNTLTATDGRPAGIFPTNAYIALKQHLYPNGPIPRPKRSQVHSAAPVL